MTAIFCMTDRMAGGVYDYLENRDLVVGKDISVAGFDDQDIAEYFRPRLTTTRLPLKQIGICAAEAVPGKNSISARIGGMPAGYPRRVCLSGVPDGGAADY